MQEWGVYWQAIASVAAIVFGIAGLKKIQIELSRINEQREQEANDRHTEETLKRTEFFLDQHRRLFDNKDLYEVLCLIDGDDPRLADQSMWDKKRKLLTFFEEIALLVSSKHIKEDIACYMFGYYIQKALGGKNFQSGINPSPENWGALYRFSEKIDLYFIRNIDGPNEDLLL